MNDIYLRYIGKDKGTLIGVPAKNMTYTEAHQYNVENLVNSGLYEYTMKLDITFEHDPISTAKTIKFVDKPMKRPYRRKE